MPALPELMTEIGFSQPGGPEVLQPRRVPVPHPGPGQVLVKVRAAGVNRPDVLQRRGLYPMPPGVTPVPGLEVAGEVVALGEGVQVVGFIRSPSDRARSIRPRRHIPGG